MKNIRVDTRSSRDISERIDRIHRDVGYVDGKVSLPEVRELLKLDLQFYRTDDPGLLDEVVHKLKVGAKQIILRPTLLIEAVKKFDLSALFVPDSKRILIDAGIPDLKKRWCESHEVAHSIIPWHGDYMLGDNRMTLSQDCHDQIEAEANYGAGRILFPNSAFSGACSSNLLNLTFVRSLAKHFGNTITSTLWRCIEQSNEASFAVIGEHPHHHQEGRPRIEYFVRSQLFEKQFSKVGGQEVWEWIQSYCAYKKSGPLGSSEIVLQDDNGGSQVFSIESFGNGYNTLTLARKIRPAQLVIAPTTKLVAL
jgi:Zn-dependent peptidase ImmA (M78 family)